MSTATITRTAAPTSSAALTGTAAPKGRVRATRVGDRPVRGVEPAFGRPADGRPLGPLPATPRVRGSRCAAPASSLRASQQAGAVAEPRPTVARRVYARRRAAAVAVLVGVALAGLVWVVAIVGSGYAASVAPAPIGTEVVHVRSGDSLTSIAERIAPDVPRQAVIDEIVARNDLSGAGLHVGQALVAPAYR
ncbi:LysM peptidoglycan-binding domain-containing protein [Gordonia sp. CPCC 205515]|uniref:LysM peptidoglycan-binding domain-containing protein n=1 Tax=Gordonia sp. CPCC 205515 TaxID=3140791 RepID=UPI003AF36BC7